jgi:hypothetical protein
MRVIAAINLRIAQLRLDSTPRALTRAALGRQQIPLQKPYGTAAIVNLS